MFGDADVMSGSARGGDDMLVRGRADNYMIGDANSGLSGNARGGNDTLIGGYDAGNNVFGDAAASMSDNARGGDDTLIGGAGGENRLRAIQVTWATTLAAPMTR